MAVRPTSLAVENLESRFNLSTLLGHLPTSADVGTFTQDRALFAAKTKVISLTADGAGAGRGLAGTMHKKGQLPLAARPGSTTPAPAVSVTASTKAITVTWVNNSTNVSGFKVERSTDGKNYAIIGSAGAGKTTFNDKTAVEGVKYIYRVTAYNKTSSTSSTDSSQVALEPLPPPAAPTGLVASKSTATSITLSWKDNASNESGFHLYRSTDGQTYTLVASLKANTKTYTDAQLAAGQTYYYELSAWSPNGEAYAAIPFTASTTKTAPMAPGNLAFTNVTAGGLTVSWTDASTNIDGFKVFRSTDGKNYTQVGTLDRKTTSFTDTGLTAGTGYAYEVGAFNTTATEMSKAATVSTLQALPAAPAAPSNLAFSNVTSSGLTLSWTNNSTTQTGFVVYRSTDGAHFVAVTTMGANDSHFNDTNLSAGTTYWYKVGAGNAGGQGLSEATSVLTAVPVVTPPVTTTTSAPAAPANLSFTGVTATGLTLHWTETASGQTGLHVYRSTDGVHFTLMATLAPGENAWADSTLSATTGYAYQVSAFNGIGETRSTAATVSTLAGPPAAPSNVNFTSVTASGVTLNWTAPASGGQNGFRIYRSTDGTNYTLVNTAGASSTTWTDSGLAGATTYSYEVAAYNAGGETRTAAQQTTTAAAVVVTPPVTGGAPTFAIKNMTSFNELVITATTGNDSILVTQSNGTLNITANGATYTYANYFGDMKIYGVGGNDTITVNSTVNINTLIYGGDGNDTIVNQTTGKATIVTIGNGVNNVTGNGVNTAYWVNAGDTVHATTAETALGGVNRVTGFYNGVARNLYGQNLTDPTDSGTEKRLTNSSLWGTGAVMNDIVQTGLADCYFLAPLASLANNEPQKLMNMGVDLGDGTYAFRFVRGGTTTYVRVDGDLATGYWNYGLANATPGADGNQWGGLFEKAYAEFRTGANTYASLNWGAQSQTFSDLGVSSSAISPSATSATALASTINSNLSANHAVVASTNGTIKNNAPLIYSHVYSVIGAFTNSSGTVMIQLRNPWGVDGAGNDGNTSDAIVTVDYATFIANFGALNYATA